MMLTDTPARRTFCQDTRRNASVTAPAGVGKTWAITERVSQLALGPQGREELERLVVVTYTRKAAQQMQERVQKRLAGSHPELLRGLEGAFFGTIHGFCLKLLKEYGVALGPLSLAPDDDTLWLRFLREGDLGAVPEALQRYTDSDGLLVLAKHSLGAGPHGYGKELAPRPKPCFESLLAYTAQGRTAAGVRRAQETLRQWVALPGRPLPDYTLSDGTFRQLWENDWGPFKQWLTEAAWAWLEPLSQRFHAFCLEKGFLTYESMVYTAAQMLKDERLRKRIQAKKFNVILDEAQDTDALQFEVLLGVASDQARKGSLYFPQQGRFCMVGDPQQSIFGSRADLETYLDIEKTLHSSGCLERLVFNVTFRCSQAIVAGLNTLFPKILQGKQQASYVPLEAAEQAPLGAFCQYTPVGGAPAEANTHERCELEATALALWLEGLTPQQLGARNWCQVAILAPRNAWLSTLAAALQARGNIPFQVLSDTRTHAQDPVYAHALSLLLALTQPSNRFEIAKTLRSLFGCSDASMADFAANGGAFVLQESREDPGPIGQSLQTLARWSASIQGLCPLMAWRIISPKLEARLFIEKSTLHAGLQRLSLLALQAQQSNQDLNAFVASLRQQAAAPLPTPAPKPGHLQLLSCHKAKGLEWEVVLIPFLHRPILYAQNPFPRLQKENGIFKLELFKSPKDFSENPQRYELQRLLYVTCTRAKNNLILINDSAFYPETQGSFAALLGPLDLPAFSPCNAFTQEPPAPPQRQSLPDWQPARARVFPKIQTPSHFAAQKGFREAPDDGYLLGKPYGQWWHSLMETLPWAQGPQAWEAHARPKLPSSPDPQRAHAEFQRFLDSELAHALQASGAAFWTELPFFYPQSPTLCWEGAVDLLVRTHEDRFWLIDWKTERQGPCEAHFLQVQAYVEALKATLGAEPKAIVYFTAGGGSGVEVGIKEVKG